MDTTWNFARSITRVSTHEHERWEHCLCIQSLLKNKVFEQLKLADACSASCDPASGEVLRVKVEFSKSLVPYERMDNLLFFSLVKNNIDTKVEKPTSYKKQF